MLIFMRYFYFILYFTALSQKKNKGRQSLKVRPHQDPEDNPGGHSQRTGQRPPEPEATDCIPALF